jgi:hypothetical protein
MKDTAEVVFVASDAIPDVVLGNDTARRLNDKGQSLPAFVDCAGQAQALR